MLKRYWHSTILFAPEGGAAAGADGGPATAAAAAAAAAGGAPAGGAPAGGAPAGGAPAGGAAPWYGDEQHKGYVELKGFTGVADVIKANQHLQGLVGLDKLPMPKDANDKEGYDRVYDRLGRPKSAADYKLPVPDGVDKAFAGKFAEVFHANGLNPTQAENISKTWNETVTAMAAADKAAFVTKSRSELQALAKEHGAEADAFFATAQTAAHQFGVTKEMMAKLEKAIGTRPLLEMFNKIGRGMGEDSLEDPGGGTGFMTPEMARARMAELRADKAWVDRFMNGDAGAKAEKEKLDRIIAAAMPVMAGSR